MTANRRNSLKILQVSDCHLSADAGAKYRGQNADLNLRRLLPVMRAWNPDLMLLTGDVSEDASPASYARVAVMLGTVGVPLLALPGNHDDPQVMKQHFRLGPWRGPYGREIENWLLVLLDSTEPGILSTRFSKVSLLLRMISVNSRGLLPRFSSSNRVVKPMIELTGVRISWPISARKSFLA